jgi:branched-chain amino acid transport system ATP-binding protein
VSYAIETSGLVKAFGATRALSGIDLAVRTGSVYGLLGPNGAGKTTVLLTLAGLLPSICGEIHLGGEPLPSGKTVAAARRGLVLVPDDRALFTTLTTRENLVLGGHRGGRDVGEIVELFPALEGRLDVKAGMLSGGEQQMLAIGRALMQDPRVLLIDELSMGLAPTIVESLFPVLRDVADETGAAVLLVEQHVGLALRFADRAAVLVHGEVALSGDADALAADASALETAYLGGGG